MYLEIDEGFPAHPKTLRLCGLMQNREAPWFVIRLWTWACRSAPTGDLQGLAPLDLEIAVNYFPLDGRCYAALAEARFIDEEVPGKPRAIHDWMEYTGAAIARMDAEAKRKRDYRAGKPWEVLRLEILERDQRTCRDCGARPPDDSELHVHHVIPLRKFESKRAGNHPANLVTLCAACHNRREQEFRRAEAAEGLNETDGFAPRRAPSGRTAAGRRQDGGAPDDGTARTVQTSPDQSSQDKPQPPDPDARVAGGGPDPKPTAAERPWLSAYEWRHAFGVAWARKYRQVSYGFGSDAKAQGALENSVLTNTPPSSLEALWAQRERFYGAYLRDADPFLEKAKHPFHLLVSRWGQYLPDLAGPAAEADRPRPMQPSRPQSPAEVLAGTALAHRFQTKTG